MKRDVRATAAAPSATDPGAGSMQRRAYLLLQQMIREGRVRPGEKLLEVQVARAFGVSRSPARHALQALCVDRLLRRDAGRGYVVAGHAAHRESGRLATLEETKLSPVPRWERVYAAVEQDLCTHVLYRSLRITEERLALHFGVSRTVARDVLSRMHSVGLLSKDRLGRWLAKRITPTRIRELYEMRWLLEPEALLQSAPHVSRSRLERVRAALKGMLPQLAKADSSELARLENDLHVELLAQCPNQMLLRTLGHTHVLLVSTQYIFDMYLGIDRNGIRAALREHLAVVELLLREDYAGAAALLREHLQISCGVWLQRFEAVSGRAKPPIPAYINPVAEPAPPV